ncbi:MAG: hypothetical protein P4L99_25290 [Chthoniobacter sp.]|nr:hypothetical protein [Chthoniobacter sp.]
MDRLRPSAIWIFLVLCLANSPVARSCQVPVFRYALERWAPEDYLATITPAETGLTAAEKRALDILRAAPRDSVNPLNLEIQVGPPTSETQGAARIELRYPHKLRDAGQQPIWQAPLNEQNVQRLLDSPVRRELRRRLLAGESAVWLLVESGDPAKDAAAAKAVTEALTEAQSSLKLPDGVRGRADGAERSGPRANEQAELLRTDLPLKIAFSLLRLRRNDPEEAPLLAMLTHLEDDLNGFAHEPMVFPVFGRGRVIEPLIGAGIHKDNVMECSGYLCGACSCEVKDQNPGIDLLVAANWEPVDTTPHLEIIRITAHAEQPPVRRPILPAVGGGVLLLGLAAWRFRGRASKI